MKRLLLTVLVLGLLVSTATADHYWWTKLNTANEPVTLEAQTHLVYTGWNDLWVEAWDRTWADLWLSPEDGYVAGGFGAYVTVRGLRNSPKVCGSDKPNVIDEPGWEYRRRWDVQSAIRVDSATVSFVAVAGWPGTGIDVPHFLGDEWTYGLHGDWLLRTTRPDGYVIYAPGGTGNEVAYKIGQYRLRFGPNSGNHHPGISALIIHSNQAVLWKRDGEHYSRTSDAVSSQEVVARVAVQRFFDMNLDGLVNGLDVEDFFLAMTAPEVYAAANFGVPATFNGDVNGDGAVDGLDAYWFSIAVLVGGVVDDYWDQIGYNNGST